MISVNCKNCSKEYKIKKYRLKDSKFCSKDCQFDYKNTFYKEIPIKKDNFLLCYQCLKHKSNENFYVRKGNNSCKTRNGRSQKCIECTNKITESWRIKNKNSIEGTLRIALIRAKNSSKKRKINYNLDYDYVLNLLKEQDYKCAITKKELTNTNNYDYNTVSIDRIDSNFGYEKNNVHLVCWVVNQMKNDMSLNDFIKWCETVTKNNTK